MRVQGGISVALLAVLLTGSVALATPVMAPKELPPAGYSGNQYVDSAGCVFLRTSLAGQTSWAPRVNRDRQPVCGYEPTFPDGLLDAAATVAGDAAAAATDDAAAVATGAASEPAAAEPVTKPMVAPAVAKPAKAAPAKRKKATKAPDGTVALVDRRSVAKSATYCDNRIAAAQRYLLSDGRRVTQCADAAEVSPVGYLNGLGVPGLAVSGRAPSVGEIRRAEAADQGGYSVTYAQGELTAAGRAAMVAPRAESGAGAAYYGGSLVQIGAFGQISNAERAIATLKRLGLPVSVGVGGRLRVILAGPFTSPADLSNALSLVRQNGYRDAFVTRG